MFDLMMVNGLLLPVDLEDMVHIHEFCDESTEWIGCLIVVEQSLKDLLSFCNMMILLDIPIIMVEQIQSCCLPVLCIFIRMDPPIGNCPIMAVLDDGIDLLIIMLVVLPLMDCFSNEPAGISVTLFLGFLLWLSLITFHIASFLLNYISKRHPTSAKLHIQVILQGPPPFSPFKRIEASRILLLRWRLVTFLFLALEEVLVLSA
jgi:hypothetical protein